MEPRNERSRRTRAAILDAAWRLLEEHGAEKATMAAVAKRAAVSRRAIYLHFASRAELMTALHAHVDEVLDLEASTAPVRDAPDAEAALDALAAHLARYHPRMLAISREVDRARRTDADLAVLWDEGLRTWVKGCRILARRLEDEGRLAEPWKVETAADMLVALMSDDVLERLMVDRKWSAKKYHELMSVVMRRALVKPRA